MGSKFNVSIRIGTRKKADTLIEENINVSAICEAAICKAYEDYIQNGSKKRPVKRKRMRK